MYEVHFLKDKAFHWSRAYNEARMSGKRIPEVFYSSFYHRKPKMSQQSQPTDRQNIWGKQWTIINTGLSLVQFTPMNKCCVSLLNATVIHFGAFEVIFGMLTNAAQSGVTG